MTLDQFQLFVCIVEKGTLSAAAREIGISPTTASERLTAMEKHYGVVLLNRTTRSMNLTDEGRILLAGAKLVLDEAQSLDGRIRHGASQLAGPIRISAPIDVGKNIVADVIDVFISEHPEVSIDLFLSDGFVDIVGQGFDLALRFSELVDSTLRAKRIANIHRVACAAPSYLDYYGEPKTPADLRNHNCLIMRFATHLDNNWIFESRNVKEQITVRGDRISNNGELVRLWCVKGAGIAFKSELDIADDISHKRLVPLLRQYVPETTPLQILFPPSRAQPRRVSALANAISEAVSDRLDRR